MRRREFILGATALAFLPTTVPAHASEVMQALVAELESGAPCPAERVALTRTIARMKASRPPSAGGRTIVVDLPSQNLAVYEGRDVVLESRVVVGEPEWRTPDLETTVSYVRLNPTWTVPESILKSRNWRGRLASDPAFFERLGFEMELDGRMVPPHVAARRASATGRFVQSPGEGNALGRAKIGLNAGNAIYLHDTQDRNAFQESSRTLSHGCVRVDRIAEVAGWVLGTDASSIEDLVRSDDRRDRRDLPSPVRVVSTYFTAWPDQDGVVRYYPDVYGLDGTGSAYCSGRTANYRDEVGYSRPVEGYGGGPVEMEYVR